MKANQSTIVLLLIVFALLVFCTACEDIVKGTDDDWPPVTDPAAGDDNTADDDDDTTTDDDDFTGDPTWTNFAEGFMQDYCIRCHGTPPKNDAPNSLDTYDKVKSKLNLCAGYVEAGVMPIGNPKPSQAERDAFVAWADAGGPK